jgi:hypothetical protein
VNGFDEGVLLNSPDGTRIAEGKGATEDENGHPSVVGRLALSPIPRVEVGFSGHRGPYNTFVLEGERIARQRDLAIAALDLEVRYPDWAVLGEYARAWIDVPPVLAGLAAEEQEGWYLEGRYAFARGMIPDMYESFWVLAMRLERADFDLERRGDDVRRLITGLSFRPTPDTAFKLDLALTRTRDPFALEAASTSLIGGVATYF